MWTNERTANKKEIRSTLRLWSGCTISCYCIASDWIRFEGWNIHNIRPDNSRKWPNEVAAALATTIFKHTQKLTMNIHEFEKWINTVKREKKKVIRIFCGATLAGKMSNLLFLSINCNGEKKVAIAIWLCVWMNWYDSYFCVCICIAYNFMGFFFCLLVAYWMYSWIWILSLWISFSQPYYRTETVH